MPRRTPPDYPRHAVVDGPPASMRRPGQVIRVGLSFRVTESEAAEIERWAQALDVDLSEIIREAVRRHLVQLRGDDAQT
jgi:hypothetical protein